MGRHLLSLSVDSYHCFVFFALSCASKNTLRYCICFHSGKGNDVSTLISEGGEGTVYNRVLRTFSLGHLETLPEHQRCVAGLTTCSCQRRAKRGEMLRLIYDLDETVSKRLW